MHETKLQKLMKYSKEPDYLLTVFEYVDEYADGLFTRGVVYGIGIGAVITLLAIGIIY